MAYDPNASYEAPRRPYHGQMQQQPAPAWNGYRDQYQQEYSAYDQGYNNYDQGYDHGRYDQGYGASYGQPNSFGQDMRPARQPQAPQYGNDGYQGNYQDRRQPAAERQYDPRYQQRQEKGRPQDYERQQPQAERQYQDRPSPADARVYAQAASIQKQANSKQRAKQEPAQRVQNSGAAWTPAAAAAQTQTQTQKVPDPSKMTMDEWKAKERARMHADSAAPETLAQDNAFPIFPTYQKGSRPGTASPTRSANERRGSASPTRSSKERPQVPRAESYPANGQPQLQPNDRPSLDHKQYSFEPIKDRGAPSQTPPSPRKRPPVERQPSNPAASPTYDTAPQQWPMQGQQQQPVSNMRAERNQRSPPQNGYQQQYEDEVERPYQDFQNAPQQPRHRQRPPPPNEYQQQYQDMVEQPQQDSRNAPQQPGFQQRAPPMQPIDVRRAQQPPNPVYMDHQPLSPGAVPPRPSTAHASRARGGQMPPSQEYFEGQAPPMPQQRTAPGHAPQESLSNIYSHYQDRHDPSPATDPPQTREQEIEAEMPDFDSAAPGGTSLLHKRGQVGDNAAASPPASAPSSAPGLYQQSPSSAAPMSAKGPRLYNQQHDQSTASLPNQQFYNQQQDPSVRSLPDQRGPKQKHGGLTNGFVFGVHGEPGQQQPYWDNSQQGRPPQQGMPYDQYDRPVQPPFARDQPPRKSMDDARKMPYRQAPPHAQRFPQGAPRGPPPPRGQYPPQQRPMMDRGVTTHPDPSQQRGASAPPQRKGFQGPPGPPPRGFQGAPGPPPNSAPLAQRSGPAESEPQQRNSNPDSLPQHPTPVRPGLMEGPRPANSKKPPPNSKPAPVRNYNNAQQQQAPHQRQVSADLSSKPPSRAEIDHLRAEVTKNPNNSKQALTLAKKLVEASAVLVPSDPQGAKSARVAYMNEAHKLVKKLSATGYPDAQFYLADCYGSGSLGLEHDSREAFKLYQSAAKAGHPEAAYRTAMCCEMGSEEGGGTSRDYAKALQWYRRAASLGDSSGMFKVGVISLKGLLGQPRNIGEAMNWLNRALQNGEQDNPHALYELAQLYEAANTNPEVRNKVVADDKHSLELYQKAATMGHKFSQFRLGQFYEYGSMGMPIDNRMSISWYSKAAAQGEHQAELALSGWYLTGADGILEHSDTEAYLWARKAASSEPPLAKAMFAMGYFAEQGIGCPASIEEAKKWYARAASHKFPKAQERVEELRKNGGKGSKPAAHHGKLTRKDQKRDESECVVM